MNYSLARAGAHLFELSLEEIQVKLDSGELLPSDQIYSQDLGWQKLGTVHAGLGLTLPIEKRTRWSYKALIVVCVCLASVLLLWRLVSSYSRIWTNGPVSFVNLPKISKNGISLPVPLGFGIDTNHKLPAEAVSGFVLTNKPEKAFILIMKDDAPLTTKGSPEACEKWAAFMGKTESDFAAAN